MMKKKLLRRRLNLQENFESKRSLVTKEIGKRMMKGWNLLDASSPYSVMPLMTDLDQKNEICVLCGVIGAIADKSADRSIKTWTKGEKVHVSRLPKDASKQIAVSRQAPSTLPKQKSLVPPIQKDGNDDERK